MTGELARVEAIARKLGRARSGIEIGMGDDAAVLSIMDKRTVISVDASVEGVHFQRDWITLRSLGRRALVAALSDLAAMGAKPHSALLALGLPAALTDAELMEVIDGIADASDEYDTPVVGGNVTRASELSLTTTVLGTLGPATAPLSRKGARPGDGVFVTGVVGAAALGCALLQKGLRFATSSALERFFIEAWAHPSAAIVAGQRLAGLATAAIDISDGLVQDLGHVCRASGLHARVSTDELPLAQGFRELCAHHDLEPLPLALAGGEDYVLLFTAPASATAGKLGTRIGVLTEGSPTVTVVDAAGEPIDLKSPGFQHS